MKYVKEKKQMDGVGINNYNNNLNEKNNIEGGEITIEIKGFFEQDILIKEAKRYDVYLKNNVSFNDFILIMSNLKKINKKNIKQDILINNLSIKNNKIASRYIQQNCLILSLDNAFFNEDLSLIDNIKIVSYLFTGFDLSDAVLSSFNMNSLKDKKFKILNEEQRKMYILSCCVCCPSIIWIVDLNLLNSLSKENLKIFNNAVKIRTKHGGIVLIVGKK